MGTMRKELALFSLTLAFLFYTFSGRAEVTNQPGWPISTNDWITSSITLGDVDKDGKLEVIAGSWKGEIYVLKSDGTLIDGWPVKVSGYVSASPVLGDVNGDHSPEVIAASAEGKIYAWSWDGKLLPGWPISFDIPGRNLLKLENLDEEEGYEIIIGLSNGRTAVIQNPGEEVVLLKGNQWLYSCRADIDRDGNEEIITTLASGEVKVCRENGKAVPGWPINIGSWINSPPALADLNGDGTIEIIVGCRNNKVYVIEGTGEILSGWPQSTGDWVEASPIIGDIDGDDKMEILAASFDHKIYAWKVDGTLVSGFPIEIGASIYSTPAIGDIDGDKALELIVASLDGQIHCFDLGTGSFKGNKSLPWPMFRKDARHSSRQEVGSRK